MLLLQFCYYVSEWNQRNLFQALIAKWLPYELQIYPLGRDSTIYAMVFLLISTGQQRHAYFVNCPI